MINSRVLLPNGTKVWSLFIFPDQIEALGCARQHQLQAADEVKRRRLWASPIAACHNGTLSAVSDIFNNPEKNSFFNDYYGVYGHGRRKWTSDLDFASEKYVNLEPTNLCRSEFTNLNKKTSLGRF